MNRRDRHQLALSSQQYLNQVILESCRACLATWEEFPPHVRKETWKELSLYTKQRILTAMIERRDRRTSKTLLRDVYAGCSTLWRDVEGSEETGQEETQQKQEE
jgi:hypothetical protein